MEKIDEDADALVSANSDLSSDEEGKMQLAMQQTMDSVKSQVEELKKTYKELTDLCQQKRDTFVLCMKFHMMTRQVRGYPLTTMVKLYDCDWCCCLNNNIFTNLCTI